MKIKIHSVVDIITNSSTVIYTCSDGSLSALKELVNEMLIIFGENKTFDDIFYAGIFLENNYDYEDYIEESDLEIDYTEDYIENIKKEVLFGKISRPEWMINAEDCENCSTILEIIPKEEIYTELANKLTNYLYSTNHEATYDS